MSRPYREGGRKAGGRPRGRGGRRGGRGGGRGPPRGPPPAPFGEPATIRGSGAIQVHELHALNETIEHWDGAEVHVLQFCRCKPCSKQVSQESENTGLTETLFLSYSIVNAL